MHAYLVVVWDVAAAVGALVVAASIVELIGVGRLARWLHLDVREDDR